MTPEISSPDNLHKTKQAVQDEIAHLRQRLSEYEATAAARVKQLDSLSAALQKSEKRYDSLFSQLPRGMQEEDYSLIKAAIDKLRAKGVENLKNYFVKNPEYLRELIATIEITNVNKALLDIYREESLEKYLEGEDNIDDWWGDKWVEFYASELSALAGPDKIYQDERRDTRVDGTVFETSIITSIVGGSEQNWDRVITIFEDVTDRNRNRVALIEAKTLAEVANKSKTEFLSSMSHELRTPLNAILGFSQLYQYEENLNDQQKSNAGKIYNAGQHLLTLIDEILDLSRIEAGRIDLFIETLLLEEVIKDSLILVTDMAESRGVSIDFDPTGCRGMQVEADAIRLKQVFLNLLSNAVKYNYNNGRVSIDCVQEQNGRVDIGIRDTGPGISSDKISELFKPFNRLGAEFSDVEGTGIGLVITRQLVNLMHGELKVDSIPGQGSTFTVVLISNQSNTGKNMATTNTDNLSSDVEISVPTGRPHILVAEDNPVNQELMTAQMELLSYSAEYADNGVEALKLWKTGRFQLLLTDIRMPGMDGYELIKQVRALELNTTASRIIAVTANAMKTDIDRCLETGADDVLSKPFSLDALQKMLEKWC